MHFKVVHEKEINEKETEMHLLGCKSRVLDISHWDEIREQIKEFFDVAWVHGQRKGNIYFIRGKYSEEDFNLDQFFDSYDKITQKLWLRVKKRGSKAFCVRYPTLEPFPHYLGIIVEFTKEDPLEVDRYGDCVVVEPFSLENVSLEEPEHLEFFRRLIFGWYLDLDWDAICVFWFTRWRTLLVHGFEKKKGETPEEKGYKFVGIFSREELARYLFVNYVIDMEIGRRCFDLGKFTIVKEWRGGKNANYIREFGSQEGYTKVLISIR